jgi:hypothetical protein
MGSLALLGFTVYMTVIWFKSGTKMIDEANDYLRLNGSMNDNKPIMKHPIYKKESISRTVYLRDLNEGFLKNALLPPYAGSPR